MRALRMISASPSRPSFARVAIGAASLALLHIAQGKGGINGDLGGQGARPVHELGVRGATSRIQSRCAGLRPGVDDIASVNSSSAALAGADDRGQAIEAADVADEATRLTNSSANSGPLGGDADVGVERPAPCPSPRAGPASPCGDHRLVAFQRGHGRRCRTMAHHRRGVGRRTAASPSSSDLPSSSPEQNAGSAPVTMTHRASGSLTARRNAASRRS